jgi:hypothetical protein
MSNSGRAFKRRIQKAGLDIKKEGEKNMEELDLLKKHWKKSGKKKLLKKSSKEK